MYFYSTYITFPPPFLFFILSIQFIKPRKGRICIYKKKSVLMVIIKENGDIVIPTVNENMALSL
jgi:hypothetical protein